MKNFVFAIVCLIPTISMGAPVVYEDLAANSSNWTAAYFEGSWVTYFINSQTRSIYDFNQKNGEDHNGILFTSALMDANSGYAYRPEWVYDSGSMGALDNIHLEMHQRSEQIPWEGILPSTYTYGILFVQDGDLILGPSHTDSVANGFLGNMDNQVFDVNAEDLVGLDLNAPFSIGIYYESPIPPQSTLLNFFHLRGASVTFTPIPEPQSFVLGLIGLASIIAIRRRF